MFFEWICGEIKQWKGKKNKMLVHLHIVNLTMPTPPVGIC